MEIILSKQCLSLTGCLGRGYGYHIQKRKNGFFAKRNAKGDIPRDGHLRFIFLCAELAQNRLYISDILVPRDELIDALREAGLSSLAENVSDNPNQLPDVLNASDIINFKKNNNL